MREHILLAQRFDADRLALKGDPLPLADGVQYESGFFRGDFSVSDNGLLVYGSGGSTATTTRLHWLDGFTGKPQGEFFGDPAEYTALSVSPDGKRIAAMIGDPGTGQPDIWLMDSEGGGRTR